MRLTGIKVGDIVRVDGTLGEVLEVEPHALLVRWLAREQIRRVSAREVTAVWKRAR